MTLAGKDLARLFSGSGNNDVASRSKVSIVDYIDLKQPTSEISSELKSSRFRQGRNIVELRLFPDRHERNGGSQEDGEDIVAGHGLLQSPQIVIEDLGAIGANITLFSGTDIDTETIFMENEHDLIQVKHSLVHEMGGGFAYLLMQGVAGCGLGYEIIPEFRFLPLNSVYSISAIV